MFFKLEMLTLTIVSKSLKKIYLKPPKSMDDSVKRTINNNVLFKLNKSTAGK